MKVSIVTAAYNAAATIADTLLSVAGQRWPDVEHIVIDGGSTDGTGDIVAKYQRHGGIYVSEPDNGIYDAMNKGIVHATGDVIGILNADDILATPDTLDRVVEAFATHRTDAVLGDVGFVRPADLTRIVRRFNSARFRPQRLAWGCMPAHPGMYMTRAGYDRVGLYRTDYRIAADFELIARAFGRLNMSYAHLPRILVKMRIGGVSTAGPRASWIVTQEIVRGCRENGISTNLLKALSRYPYKLLEKVAMDDIE